MLLLRNHYHRHKLELIKEQVTSKDYSYSIKSSEDMHKYLVEICGMNKNHQEAFVVIAVNSKGKIIGFTTVSIGDVSSSIVHPREVFNLQYVAMPLRSYLHIII